MRNAIGGSILDSAHAKDILVFVANHQLVILQMQDRLLHRFFLAGAFVAVGEEDRFAASGGAGQPTIFSRIASFVIKGGAAGTLLGGDNFGFVAQEIGSFQLGGLALALTAGAGNDLFPGLPVGTADLLALEVPTP